MMRIETVSLEGDKTKQVLQIPSQFIIDDDKVHLKKTGNVISIIPFHNPWQNFYDSLSLFTPDFMQERSQAEQQKRESFD